MGAAVGLHIGAMFPLYPGNPAAPVVQDPYELAGYICLEVGWALAALLVGLRWAPRGGAALGAGLGAVEIGLVVSDLSSGFQVGEGGDPGVWLALAGLVAGLAGVLYAAGSLSDSASSAPGPSRRSPVSASSLARSLLSVLAALTAVATFWPSWDHYHIVTAAGQVENVNLGDAFSQPPAVMAGELAAGFAIAATVVIAAFWRDAFVGAFAMIGAVVALASQVISGAVQASEPLAQLLGAQVASGVDLSASKISLTGYWYADIAATFVLALLALWQLASARTDRRLLGRASQPPGPGTWPPSGWPPATSS